VKTHHLIELANEIFTATGWSSEILDTGFDFVRTALGKTTQNDGFFLLCSSANKSTTSGPVVRFALCV
jgi:recombination DNA repair RAD52 pathway protein